MPNLIDQNILDRFWSKVDKSGDCWEWTAAKSVGYGIFSLNGKGASPVKAHRISFAIRAGFMPPPHMYVCHQCDNPGCVNPDHLFLATQKVNIRDASMKGRLSVATKGRAGERNNQAKLSEVQVKEIRRLVQAGNSMSRVSKIYDVHRTTISNIINERKWSHV